MPDITIRPRGPVIKIPIERDRITLPTPGHLNAIEKRHAQDPAAFGEPAGDHRKVDGAWMREYEHGVIVSRAGVAVATYGAICARWRSLGGPDGFLGLPVTDEVPTADGHGRTNRFDGGEIHWRKDLGAWEVYGAILETWMSMGGVKSVAGYPTSGELGASPGSGARRLSHFERGTIYWSPERGTTFAPSRIELWFTGLRCLDESSEASDSDEPYALLGVLVPGEESASTKETGVHEMDAGDVVEQQLLLYSGPTRDLVLAVVVREHDEGDPHAFAGAFSSVIRAAAVAAAGATGGAGAPVITAAGEALASILGPKLSELTGAGDDTVGAIDRLLTISKLAALSQKPETGAPPADFRLQIGKDSEGIYELSFLVRPT